MPQVSSRFLWADDWLSVHLGKPSFGLDIQALRADLASASPDAVAAAFNLDAQDTQSSFVYARAPNDDTGSCQWLEERGFAKVETNVIFTRAKRPHNRAARAGARLATTSDEEAVAKIARTSFRFSRFHIDPFVGPEIADAMREDWVRNYFRGLRGDALIVEEREQKIAGFLLVCRNDEADVIDLVATDPAFRKTGVGRSMINFLDMLPMSPQKIRVGTQAVNIPSIAFYKAEGFHELGNNHIYHRHGRPS